MLFTLLLATLAFGVEVDEYEGYALINEGFADAADAQAACSALGGDLCTVGQLFQVVYGTDGVYSLCNSGHLADGVVGWWNADPGFCSGTGFLNWAPAEPAAHCCTADIPDTVPVTCQEAGCSADGKILLEDNLEHLCVDGVCTDEVCCQDFTPASKLYQNIGGYTYETEVEAEAACQALHPDYQLCTRSQIQGFYDYGLEEDVCSSGWLLDDTEEGHPFAKMWYVPQERADAGYCGGNGGWRLWESPTGLGSAHCCVPSYAQGGYGSLQAMTDVDLASLTRDEQQDLARAYCEDPSKTVYPYELCTYSQLQTVVYSEVEVCMSGIMENPDPANEGDITCGWENTLETCSGGQMGMKSWCSSNAGAHCCLPYVQDYTAGYDKPDFGYDTVPTRYPDSELANGDQAIAMCLDLGYEGLCTVEQVKYVAENGGSYDNLGCLVGYMIDVDGSYVSGYWGTSCTPAKADELLTAWQPSNGNPVAHCCDTTVPLSEVVTILDPMVSVPGKGNGYPLGDDDLSVAQDLCAAEGEGYAVCTRDQVEVAATVGVERSDGSVQIADNICYQGLMADGSKGWYQVSGSCGGLTGWRSFTGGAGAHCCLDFPASLGSDAPTAAPLLPVYTFIGKNTYGSEAEALEECIAVSGAYSLCTDDEVYTIATQGGLVHDELLDSYADVDAGASACSSGYVDSLISNDGITHGWYQVQETCGAQYLQWNGWALADSATDSGVRAGAHCCVADAFEVLFNPDYVSTEPPVTTVKETTMAPSPPPTSPEPTAFVPYSDLPSTVAEPVDCEAMPELTPVDFEGVVYYCQADGMIYVNGHTTCVESADPDAATLVAEAFEESWTLAVNDDMCLQTKDYDTATDDQLFITNHMLDVLEEDIDQLESDMAAEASDLDAYLDNWKNEVVDLINGSLDSFDETTQAALVQYMDDYLLD